MEHENKPHTVFNWKKKKKPLSPVEDLGRVPRPSSAPAFLQDLADLFPVKSFTVCLLSFRTLSTSSGPAFTGNAAGLSLDLRVSLWLQSVLMTGQLVFSYHILWGPNISEQQTIQLASAFMTVKVTLNSAWRHPFSYNIISKDIFIIKRYRKLEFNLFLQNASHNS